MKGQMSLEMLAYVSIAGISLIYSMGAIGSYYLKMNQTIVSYSYSEFAQELNTATLGNYAAATIDIPPDLCRYWANGTSIQTDYGRLYFAYFMKIKKSIICTPGISRVNLSYYPGYVVIG